MKRTLKIYWPLRYIDGKKLSYPYSNEEAYTLIVQFESKITALLESFSVKSKSLNASPLNSIINGLFAVVDQFLTFNIKLLQHIKGDMTPYVMAACTHISCCLGLTDDIIRLLEKHFSNANQQNINKFQALVYSITGSTH